MLLKKVFQQMGRAKVRAHKATEKTVYFYYNNCVIGNHFRRSHKVVKHVFF